MPEISSLLYLLKKADLIVQATSDTPELIPLSFCTNSAESSPGCFFICKGFTFLKKYLEIAAEKGALLYMADIDYGVNLPHIIVSDIRKATSLAARWFYNNAGSEMELIGITGTKGKTTVAYLLKNILDAEEQGTTALISTPEINTGGILQVNHLTTPEPAELQKYLRQAKDNGCSRVVMEVSSQAMKLSRVFGEKFKIGIFLNIDEDHIGGNEHATFDEYISCKMAFLSQCDSVIVNAGTKYFDQVMAGCEGRKAILYGYNEDCDGYITDVRCTENGSRFVLHYKGRSYNFASSLLGKFNVENLTAAILAAFELGIDQETIQKGISSVDIPGRMNILEHNGVRVVVDYAHNRLSFMNVYEVIRDIFSPVHIHSVFGCAGERSEVRLKGICEMAEKYADYVYLTTEDPGYENAKDICEKMKQYIKKPCRIIIDREEAVRCALDAAKPGDVVLLAGKGEETSLRVRGKFVPYISDEEAAKKWMSEH